MQKDWGSVEDVDEVDDEQQPPNVEEDEPLWKRSSSRAERFPKTLFALSRCRITRASGSGDLLSRSSVHVDDRDGVAYSGSAAGG